MGGCIVYTRIRLLPLICPFISSFFFLSNYQTVTIFVTLFSGTVRPRKLKLGTHVDNQCMYSVYRNKATYLSLYFGFFIFLSLHFQTVTIFVTLFSGTVRPRRLKLGTRMDSGQMYREYRSQAAALICHFIFLSHQFSNLNMFYHIFLRNCEA